MRCVRRDSFKYIRNFTTDKGYEDTKWVNINNPTLQVIKTMYKEGNLNQVQALHMAAIKAREELYDLRIDPYELNNLSNSADHQQTLKKMRILVNEWIVDTEDTGQFPENREDALETPWFNFDEVYSNKESKPDSD